MDIANLLDEAQIKKVHMRYCRGVDRLDWDLVRSCYHPDATDDHGAYNGGIDGFIGWAAAALAKFTTTTHFTGNQLVEVEGDSAWAEHYAIVYHRRGKTEAAPEADMIVNVRYVDRMDRRDGEWKISRRIVIADASRIDLIQEAWLPADPQVSRRDRLDRSYRQASEQALGTTVAQSS